MSIRLKDIIMYHTFKFKCVYNNI